jgi:hypothetical protein
MSSCNDKSGPAAAYPAGDALFRGTRWRGADCGYTIDLGNDRSLWLFGDSFVAEEGVDTRLGSRFVNNTIGLQTGRDPATAVMEFRWGETPYGPGAFFPREDDTRYFWPAHGARLGNRVLVFTILIGPSRGIKNKIWGVVPFHVEGWRAFWIDGIDGPLASWTLSRADDIPEDGPGRLGAAVLVDDDWMYVWSVRKREGWLCRFDLDRATAGDLSSPRWWDGTGWTVEAGAAALALMPATSEFTVHRRGDRFLLVDVHSCGVPETGIQLRWSDRPEGPWTRRSEVYRIPEAARPGVLAYAGKAHPQLDGPGLLVTYASNTRVDDGVIWADESLYYPRFVRVEV